MNLKNILSTFAKIRYLNIFPYRESVISACLQIIETGYREDKLLDLLRKNSPNLLELGSILQIMVNSGTKIARIEPIADSFQKYIDENKLEVPKTYCFNCGIDSEKIKGNFETVLMKDEHKQHLFICTNCQKKKSVTYCPMHCIYIHPEVIIKCGLFDKCVPDNCCPNPACMERHMLETHKNYEERKWKNVKKFISKIPGDIVKLPLKVGVEFEAIGKDEKSSRKSLFLYDRNIGIGNDQSIRGFINPIEVQTPPASGRKYESLIRDICSKLIENGFTVNEMCGLHLHIDLYSQYGHLADKPDFYKSLLAAYTLYEPLFLHMLPISRRRNRFALPIRNSHTDSRARYGETIGWHHMFAGDLTFTKKKRFSKLWYLTDDIKRLELRKANKRDLTKYTSVNFHSLIRGEGLEIRSLEGTLDPDLILRWTQLHQEFIQGVSKFERPFYEIYKEIFAGEMKIAQSGVPNYYLQKFIDQIKPSLETVNFIRERYEICSNSGQFNVMEGGRPRFNDAPRRTQNQNIDISEQTFRALERASLNSRVRIINQRPQNPTNPMSEAPEAPEIPVEFNPTINT